MRLYALMFPTGTWDQPCLVKCSCGWSQQARTCDAAKVIAWAHDREHWAGQHVEAEQGALPLETGS